LVGKSSGILAEFHGIPKSRPFLDGFFVGIQFFQSEEKNDVIGICSHRSGIAKNPFPISHIVYCSYLKNLWNSSGIPITVFSSERFSKSFLTRIYRILAGFGIPLPASNGGSQKSEKAEFPT
jgi:hypothetical protein